MPPHPGSPFTSEERPYLGGSDWIKRLPHLIIAPGTLKSQWIHELKTFFLPKSVDIIPYDCPKSGNPEFWSPTGPFHSSKQKPQNKIIVMSQSVRRTSSQFVVDADALITGPHE